MVASIAPTLKGEERKEAPALKGEERKEAPALKGEERKEAPALKGEERRCKAIILKLAPFRAGGKKLMKQLSQIIALYLFGLNALEIISAAGVVVLMLKMFMDKFLISRRRWRIRKKKREIESNMWAIE